MQEIRCTKCGKLLCKTNVPIGHGAVEIDAGLIKTLTKTDKYLEIKCPHRVNKNGKNETCGTINRIEI
jgi:phage FluMu protein Com